MKREILLARLQQHRRAESNITHLLPSLPHLLHPRKPHSVPFYLLQFTGMIVPAPKSSVLSSNDRRRTPFPSYLPTYLPTNPNPPSQSSLNHL